ncbi:response regulator transcription factor [Microvirga sp. BT689]|uniref:LuxR C-terminal-related transcriptional regulator n=1 Tax=Microvirga arvi TaxID=2778731 RepID=UPI00194FB5DC|nr:response regulator transcription factor [Microvirga arvi]MBM6584374.1 response regulator transcription factor [Microvirga arvi]
MNMIRVAVVDDHPLYREGVVHVLNRHDDIGVVAQGECAEDAVRIAQEVQPHVMVLDMNMPGSGLSAVTAINSAHPGVRVLFLSVVIDEDQVCQAINSGARGYLLKGAGGEELARTVRAIYSGETYVAPSLAGHLLAHLGRKTAQPLNKETTLSPRQEQILQLIGQGLSNKEVATKLQLTERTVKYYMTNLLQKLQVRNRTEAALLANRRAAAGT